MGQDWRLSDHVNELSADASLIACVEAQQLLSRKAKRKPARAGCPSRYFLATLGPLKGRARAPAAAEAVEAAVPDRPRSPVSPSRPGMSASPEAAAEAAGAGGAAAEATRSCKARSP